MFLIILPSTDNSVTVTATPRGLCASNVISPVSSGYTSDMVRTDVPSSKFSTINSSDGIISVPCFNHLPTGFGFPIAFTSNLK